MAERPNLTRTQETSPLHEQGGLAPEHWRGIYNRLPWSQQHPLWKDISSYSKRVIKGEFSGLPSHHRQYLGSRHWEAIRSLNLKEDKVIPRRIRLLGREFPWISDIKVINSRQAIEVWNYALEEQIKGIPTMQETLFQRVQNSSFAPWSSCDNRYMHGREGLLWNGNSKRGDWAKYVWEQRNEDGPWFFPSKEEVTTAEVLERFPEISVFNLDPLRTSPIKIAELIIKEAVKDPEKYAKLYGPIEKPINKLIFLK